VRFLEAYRVGMVMAMLVAMLGIVAISAVVVVKVSMRETLLPLGFGQRCSRWLPLSLLGCFGGSCDSLFFWFGSHYLHQQHC
jgi:hypothetical protein